MAKPQLTAASRTASRHAAAPETLAALLARLDTSEAGLSADEAERRLDRYGSNEPAAPGRSAVIFELLRFCANPLVLVLFVAAGVSAALGEVVSAAIIFTMVGLGIALDFVQSFRSDRAARRLRDRVAATAMVARAGHFVEVPRRSLVPGDVVRLAAGDLVPADGRLVQSRDLHVQQAALTGESLPVEKRASPLAAADTAADAEHLVFLGTSVVSGTATAVITATGPSTAFGHIAAHLSARPPETEFERGTRQFGALIMQTVVFLVLFILVVSIALRHPALESLLFAVALAVGLTPEFLPMITTVTLARGAVAMAREKVIVKHLAAIQNLGSIDVLCSDKTGTLTEGTMRFERAVDARGDPSERPLLLGWLNSRHETGIQSPLEAAILKMSPAGGEGFQKTDELPFDFERRRLSVVLRDAGGGHLFITKGAPEGVLAACSAVEIAGATLPMGEAERARGAEIYRALSAEGLRTLAVAYRSVGRADGFTTADERGLVLAGFVAFADPPLPGAAETVAALGRDGVQVKILTGDNELVTRHLCGQIGLDCQRIVLGDELDRTSDSALAHVVEQVQVFARLDPAQKNRILRALRARNHVVGFLGDGINDAPSLRSADVGISVAGAVDVARDAADIILLEPRLEVLHKGILEGRRAFGNLLKYLLMGTSSNFGNMFSMAGASIFLPFLPMLPPQILLNNFLYDLAQVTIPTDNVDDAFIRKPQRWDMRIVRNFMLIIGPISSLYDFLTFFILLRVFHASEVLFHTGWFVESLATQTLVLFVIRTVHAPWRSRPSKPLAVTTLAVVLVAVALPLSPLAGVLGFTRLPLGFFLFLAAAAATYLALVEVVKRRLMARLLS